MTKTKFGSMDQLVKETCEVIIRVYGELRKGVREQEFTRRYLGQYVCPGVSVRQHLEELRRGGCLQRRGDMIALKQRETVT